MKYHLPFAALSLTLAFSAIFSINTAAQQNVLKITPFQPLLGKFSVQYERATAAQNSIVFEFQHWNERRQNGAGLFVLGIFVSSTDVTTTKGYRMQIMGRHYTQKALNGTFLEGGAYVGKHDIEVRSETQTLNFWAIFSPDPLNIYQSQVNLKQYKDVHVGGLKLGLGLQKSVGWFTMECSGGLNLNLFNDKNARPNLSQKIVAPYARIALGAKF